MENLDERARRQTPAASQSFQAIHQRRIGRGQSSGRAVHSLERRTRVAARLPRLHPRLRRHFPCAQGKTVDEVLVVASSRSLPAVHREQFYVSISRGRQRCHVFTDDKDLLRAHIAHSSIRTAAVEAVATPKTLRALVRQLLAWAENFRRLVRLGQVLRQPMSPQKPIAWTRKVRRHHRYEYHHDHSRTLRV